MGIDIRLERPEDYRAVEEVTREAFWNLFVPGCDEHYLAHILRGVDAFIPALDFVALAEGRVVGNIMYSKGRVEAEGGAEHPVILFGPLSVLPAYQRRGVGSALVRHSAWEAAAMGHRAILIYGDPAYYGRLGFKPASAYGIRTGEGRELPALQALELAPGGLAGVAGRFFEDPVFETINAKDVEAFDRTFPPKEKAVTESQKRFAQLSAGAV